MIFERIEETDKWTWSVRVRESNPMVVSVCLGWEGDINFTRSETSKFIDALMTANAKVLPPPLPTEEVLSESDLLKARTG